MVEKAVQERVDIIKDHLQGNEECTANDDGNSNLHVLVTKPIAFQFISCSLQTGANVSDKLKNQIWAEKYTDFHLLLENDGNEFKFQFEMECNNP